MAKYSPFACRKGLTSSILASLLRPLRIAIALAASATTLSCAPNARLQSALAPMSLSTNTYFQAVADTVESGRVTTQDAPAYTFSTDGMPAEQTAFATSDSSGSMVADDGHAVSRHAALLDKTSVRAVDDNVRTQSSNVGGASEVSASFSVPEPRFEWVSVDTYHSDPPKYNALGRFEERWYAAHNFTTVGAGIASLEEGDLLLVDGVLLEVAWLYDGSYESSYSEVRSIVGLESTCFQTCTGIGTGIRVAVCYPA